MVKIVVSSFDHTYCFADITQQQRQYLGEIFTNNRLVSENDSGLLDKLELYITREIDASVRLCVVDTTFLKTAIQTLGGTWAEQQEKK